MLWYSLTCYTVAILSVVCGRSLDFGADQRAVRGEPVRSSSSSSSSSSISSMLMIDISSNIISLCSSSSSSSSSMSRLLACGRSLDFRADRWAVRGEPVPAGCLRLLVYLFTSVFLCLLACLLACLLVCLFVCLFVCLCVCLFVCLSVCMCVCLFQRRPTSLARRAGADCLFVCLFVCLCVCLFVCLCACVFVCLCVCVFVCVFVWVFVCFSAERQATWRMRYSGCGLVCIRAHPLDRMIIIIIRIRVVCI